MLSTRFIDTFKCKTKLTPVEVRETSFYILKYDSILTDLIVK